MANRETGDPYPSRCCFSQFPLPMYTLSCGNVLGVKVSLLLHLSGGDQQQQQRQQHDRRRAQQQQQQRQQRQQQRSNQQPQGTTITAFPVQKNIKITQCKDFAVLIQFSFFFYVLKNLIRILSIEIPMTKSNFLPATRSVP